MTKQAEWDYLITHNHAKLPKEAWWLIIKIQHLLIYNMIVEADETIQELLDVLQNHDCHKDEDDGCEICEFIFKVENFKKGLTK